MFIAHRLRLAFRFLASIAAATTIGCVHQPISPWVAEDCLKSEAERIRGMPLIETILTLDGQRVPLDEFFRKCERGWPGCVLFEKFYHWKTRILKVTSDSDTGPLEHTIRIYLNPLSICRPERVNPGRIYGDVAEFYDKDGEFMGLAVYLGQGLYYPIPYSHYSKSQ